LGQGHCLRAPKTCGWRKKPRKNRRLNRGRLMMHRFAKIRTKGLWEFSEKRCPNLSDQTKKWRKRVQGKVERSSSSTRRGQGKRLKRGEWLGREARLPSVPSCLPAIKSIPERSVNWTTRTWASKSTRRVQIHGSQTHRGGSRTEIPRGGVTLHDRVSQKTTNCKKKKNKRIRITVRQTSVLSAEANCAGKIDL